MRILGDHAVCRGFAPKSGLVFRVNLDLLKILIKLKQNIGKNKRYATIYSCRSPHGLRGLKLFAKQQLEQRVLSQPACAAGIEISSLAYKMASQKSQPAWAAENTRTILRIYAAF